MYVFIVCVIGLLTAGDMSVTAADSAVDARVYRACGSADSVVCVFTYARHGIIIINPGQHTRIPGPYFTRIRANRRDCECRMIAAAEVYRLASSTGSVLTVCCVHKPTVALATPIVRSP